MIFLFSGSVNINLPKSKLHHARGKTNKFTGMKSAHFTNAHTTAIKSAVCGFSFTEPLGCVSSY